jgi:hypothetical protein
MPELRPDRSVFAAPPEGAPCMPPKSFRMALAVFAVFWLVLVSWFSLDIVRPLYDGLREVLFYQPMAAAVTAATPAQDSCNASIEYVYQVEGGLHKGLARWPLPSATEAGLAAPLPAVGDLVTVYVDPARPWTHVTEPTIPAVPIAELIFITPFFLVGLVLAYAALRAPPEVFTVQGGKRLIPTLACLATYMAVSAVMGLAFFLPAHILPWRWGVAAGMVLWLVVVPAVSLVIGRTRTARWCDSLAREAPPLADSSAVMQSELVSAGPAGRPPRKRKTQWLFGFFAIFWCAITGAFTVVVAGTILNHLDAQMRFVSIEGTVVSSEVKTADSEDGPVYAPQVRFRYTVEGRSLASDRYSFDASSSSDRAYAAGVVADHPAGKTVTVWYDPDRPDVAILQLQVPQGCWFLLIFLQPFQVVAIVLVWGWAWWLGDKRRIRRYLAEQRQVPCRLPVWGLLHQDAGGLIVTPRRGYRLIVGGFGAGWMLACFASIFVIGLGMGTWNPEPRVLAIALAAALGAGLAGSVILYRISRKAVVRIESGRGGAVTVISPRRQTVIPWEEVSTWTVLHVPGKYDSESRSFAVWVVCLVTTGGETSPVHAFTDYGRGEDALAAKVAADLADLTARPFCEWPATGARRPPDMPFTNANSAVWKIFRDLF